MGPKVARRDAKLKKKAERAKFVQPRRLPLELGIRQSCLADAAEAQRVQAEAEAHRASKEAAAQEADAARKAEAEASGWAAVAAYGAQKRNQEEQEQRERSNSETKVGSSYPTMAREEVGTQEEVGKEEGGLVPNSPPLIPPASV